MISEPRRPRSKSDEEAPRGASSFWDQVPGHSRGCAGSSRIGRLCAARPSVQSRDAPVDSRAPAVADRLHRSGRDRVLGYPLPPLAHVAVDGRVLPLRLGAAGALADRALGAEALGAAADSRTLFRVA